MTSLLKRVTAFTIVEMVIVISIIGLIITIPAFAYSNYVRSSRDTRRKNDINQMHAALQNYKSATGAYPLTASVTVLVTQGYLPKYPTDPLQGQNVAGETGVTYTYTYTSTNGTTYNLSTRLENRKNFQAVYYVSSPAGPREVTKAAGSGAPATSSPFPSNTLIPSLTPVN